MKMNYSLLINVNLVKFVPEILGKSRPSSAESISRGFTLFDIEPKRRKCPSARCPSAADASGRYICI
jgi:hypothetical protein